MTSEYLQDLQATVDQGRELIAAIRLTRERLAWLESDEPLYVAFDRGASEKNNISSQRVAINPTKDTMARLREMLLEELAGELDSLQKEFAQLGAP